MLIVLVVGIVVAAVVVVVVVVVVAVVEVVLVVVFSRVLRDSTLRFLCPSVRPSVTLYFFCFVFLFFFCGFWPYCSCPNDLVTSIMAPAHPHATGVAVYPALFLSKVGFSYI